MTNKEIGERLFKVRRSSGLNQSAFAQKLGTSSGRISEIEAGKSMPGSDFLVRLAHEFATDIHWLLTGSDAEVAAPLEGDEISLLNNYRHMARQDQAHYKAIGDSLAKSKDVKKKAG